MNRIAKIAARAAAFQAVVLTVMALGPVGDAQAPSGKITPIQQLAGTSQKPGEIQLAVTDQEIRFIDPDGMCGNCGTRGHLDGAAFPRTARRPIRYMARLKSSREYREAVTAGSQP